MAAANPSFVCDSGELLWGQLHCIAEGHLANRKDLTVPEDSTCEGGTIIQKNYEYCVKAARGQWNVGQINSRYERNKPEFVAGFIAYNSELVEPVSIIKCCAEIGMSTKDYGEKSIVYINRYDWSWAHQMPQDVQRLLNADLNGEQENRIEEMIRNRLILADASAGLDVINQLKQNLTDISKNSLIKETLVVDNAPVGVHLACPNTEYELGWMVFNSAEPKELIAFVYDGAHSLLEGELTLNENTCIKSAAEFQDQLNEWQKASQEFTDNHNAALEAKDVADLGLIFNNRNGKTAEIIADELLQANFDLAITSDLLNQYRNSVDDLGRIFQIMEEKKMQKPDKEK